jgi:predicted Ser/Thr protein kinase
LIGRTVSHYVVTAELGRGGMGTVFLAEDMRLGRPVALKFLAPERASDARARARFESEARAAARLSHPNIATLHDVGTSEGETFLVMEYVEGRTLADRLDEGLLSYAELLDVVDAVAAGLAHAHERGIVHRDIKPSNIMLLPDGRLKILDMGLARHVDATAMTGDSHLVGTLRYMSPETVAGVRADRTSDVWSTGVLLYRCVTGRLPFDGESAPQVIGRISSGSFEPVGRIRSDLPPHVAALIDGCLEVDPGRRIRDGRGLQEAVARARGVSEGSTEQVPVSVRRSRPVGRRAVLGGLAFVLVAVLAGILWWQDTPRVARRTVEGDWPRAAFVPETTPTAQILVTLDADDPGTESGLEGALTRHFAEVPDVELLWNDASRRAALGEEADPRRLRLQLAGGRLEARLTPKRLDPLLVSERSWTLDLDSDDEAERVSSIVWNLEAEFREAGLLSEVQESLAPDLSSTARVAMAEINFLWGSGLVDRALGRAGDLATEEPSLAVVDWARGRILEGQGDLLGAREAFEAALPKVDRWALVQGRFGRPAVLWPRTPGSMLLAAASRDRSTGVQSVFHDAESGRLFGFTGTGAELSLVALSLRDETVDWSLPLADARDREVAPLVILDRRGSAPVFLGSKTGWTHHAERGWTHRRASRHDAVEVPIGSVWWIADSGRVLHHEALDAPIRAHTTPAEAQRALVALEVDPPRVHVWGAAPGEHRVLRRPLRSSSRTTDRPVQVMAFDGQVLLLSDRGGFARVSARDSTRWSSFTPGESIVPSLLPERPETVHAARVDDETGRLTVRDLVTDEIVLDAVVASLADAIGDGSQSTLVRRWNEFFVIEIRGGATSTHLFFVEPGDTPTAEPRQWSVHLPVEGGIHRIETHDPSVIDARSGGGYTTVGRARPGDLAFSSPRGGVVLAVDPRLQEVDLLASFEPSRGRFVGIQRAGEFTIVARDFPESRVTVFGNTGLPLWGRSFETGPRTLSQGFGFCTLNDMLVLAVPEGRLSESVRFEAYELRSGRELWRQDAPQGVPIARDGSRGYLLSPEIVELDLQRPPGAQPPTLHGLWWKLGSISHALGDSDRVELARRNLLDLPRGEVYASSLEYLERHAADDRIGAWNALVDVLERTTGATRRLHVLRDVGRAWGLEGWRQLAGPTSIRTLMPRFAVPRRQVASSRGSSMLVLDRQVVPFGGGTSLEAPVPLRPSTSMMPLGWLMESTTQIDDERVLSLAVEPAASDSLADTTTLWPALQCLRVDPESKVEEVWFARGPEAIDAVDFQFGATGVFADVVVVSGFHSDESTGDDQRMVAGRTPTTFLPRLDPTRAQRVRLVDDRAFTSFVWVVDLRSGRTLGWVDWREESVRPFQVDVRSHGDRTNRSVRLAVQWPDEVGVVEFGARPRFLWRSPLFERPVSEDTDAGSRTHAPRWSEDDRHLWTVVGPAARPGSNSLEISTFDAATGERLHRYQEEAGARRGATEWSDEGLVVTWRDDAGPSNVSATLWAWPEPTTNGDVALRPRVLPDVSPTGSGRNWVHGSRLFTVEEGGVSCHDLVSGRRIWFSPLGPGRESDDTPQPLDRIAGDALLIWARGGMLAVVDLTGPSVRFAGPDPLRGTEFTHYALDRGQGVLRAYGTNSKILRTWKLRDTWDAFDLPPLQRLALMPE